MRCLIETRKIKDYQGKVEQSLHESNLSTTDCCPHNSSTSNLETLKQNQQSYLFLSDLN